MTTQELKEYINSKLGNSLRTLLPSYWWKRLFGLVIDKVEDVKGSIYTSIDEFAKNRPDIYARTFYLSEKAEHIAHNAVVVRRCQLEAMQGELRPYYIATMIEDSPEIWWVRNDGYAPTSGISTFTDVEDGGNKYRVMFGADGTAYKVEVQEDSVIIDTEMSSTSENAVQNKVIKEYVDKAVQNVNITLDSALSDTSTNAVQNKVVASAFEAVVEELEKKVDKVEGKQLSTEDFTTELKEKLNGLSEISQSDEIYVGSEMPTDDNIVVWIDPDASIGDVDWDGITVDEEFSPTSTNPVQNKTVYTLLERLDGIEAILDNINGE